MKIENIKIDFNNIKEVNEKDFNLDEWRKSQKIDYFMSSAFLLASDNPSVINEVFITLYKIIQLYIPSELYKYSSLDNREKLNEKKLKTLKDKKVFMSSIESFNDPFDSKAFFYKPQEIISIDPLRDYNGIILESTKLIRCACFSANGVNSMPMWAHYGNNHKGFCVKYEMKDNPIMKQLTFPIQYTDERLDITSFIKKYLNEVLSIVVSNLNIGVKETVLNDLSLVYLMLLLSNVKHNSWEYEKEFRVSTSTGDHYVEAIPAAIYAGMNCEPDNIDKLKQIAAELGIPFYKMKFDDQNEKYQLLPDKC
jgi:hypothetical protein